MKWTAQKPTTPGIYWFRWSAEFTGREIVHVYEHEDEESGRRGLWAYNTLELVSNWVEDLGGEWAGPIPEPTE